VVDTGRWETVYNITVAEWHTYFVGAPEWGFSAWAHNAYVTPQHTHYGNDVLSLISLEPRQSGRLLRRHNAVVLEYFEQSGNIRYKLFKNVQADRVLGRRAQHAEQVMHSWL